MLSIELIIFLTIGAFAGGFINGLAGFGTSLFALGWWLQVLPPVQAVAISLTMSVATGLPGLYEVRKGLEWKRLSPFLIPALFGIPFGLFMLAYIDAIALKRAIAFILILYAGYFSFRKNLLQLTHKTPLVDAAVGLLSGFMGAIAGLSGAAMTMWISMREMTKQERRSILQPFNFIVIGISLVLILLQGKVAWTTLGHIAIALPTALIASRIGILVYRRLNDSQFRRLLITLMLVSGIVLLLRS